MPRRRIKQSPIQFDFQAYWFEEIRTIRQLSLFQDEFERIKERYFDISELKFEEFQDYDRIHAYKELQLSRHTAEVMYSDLQWLRENFSGYELSDLSLGIAEALYPDKKWTVIEDGEEAIVTDTDRNLVFDMKYFDKFSAKGSLLNAGDNFYVSDRGALEELYKFKEIRSAQFRDVLSKLKKHLTN